MNDYHDPAMYGGKPKTAAEEWQEIRREVGAILNVGASMMAVGTAVWWVGGGRSYAAVRLARLSHRLRHLVVLLLTSPVLSSPFPLVQRLSLAMSGAVAIAVIEAFLYYRFFTRTKREQADLAKRKARGAAKSRARVVASSSTLKGAEKGGKAD